MCLLHTKVSIGNYRISKMFIFINLCWPEKRQNSQTYNHTSNCHVAQLNPHCKKRRITWSTTNFTISQGRSLAEVAVPYVLAGVFTFWKMPEDETLNQRTHTKSQKTITTSFYRLLYYCEILMQPIRIKNNKVWSKKNQIYRK